MRLVHTPQQQVRRLALLARQGHITREREILLALLVKPDIIVRAEKIKQPVRPALIVLPPEVRHSLLALLVRREHIIQERLTPHHVQLVLLAMPVPEVIM